MDNLLDIGGVEYVIDFEAMHTMLNSDKSLAYGEVTEVDVKEIYEGDECVGKEVYTKTFTKGREIDMTRYEMLRLLFEVVLTYNEDIDDSLGVERGLSKTTLPFKLSYNTLINYGIIKEI